MSSCADGFAFRCEGDPNQLNDWKLMERDEVYPDNFKLPDDPEGDCRWYELLFQLDRLIISTYKQHVDIYYGNNFTQHEWTGPDYGNNGGVRLYHRKVYRQEIFIISDDWEREIIPYPITSWGLIRTPDCEYMFTQGYYIGYCWHELESKLRWQQCRNIAFDLYHDIPQYFGKKEKKVRNNLTIKRRHGNARR